MLVQFLTKKVFCVKNVFVAKMLRRHCGKKSQSRQTKTTCIHSLNCQWKRFFPFIEKLASWRVFLSDSADMLLSQFQRCPDIFQQHIAKAFAAHIINTWLLKIRIQVLDRLKSMEKCKTNVPTTPYCYKS